MPCNDALKRGPARVMADPRRRYRRGVWRGANRGGFDPAATTGPGGRRALIILLASLAALLVTLAGFFQPAAPLWFAGLPLLAGILRGTPYARAGAVAAFMIWPAILCAAGLHNIGLPPFLIWPGAALAVATLAGLAGYIGLAPLALVLTLIPVFPASPLLVLAELLPGFGLGGAGLAGLGLLLAGLFCAEFSPRWRSAVVLLLVGGVIAWGQVRAEPVAPETAWSSQAAPRTVTERAHWIALRDSLPIGAQAILGENLFAAQNHEAAAFWCHAARAQNLTLWIGVRGEDRRGQVWRFDRDLCAQPTGGPARIHAARYGIPGLTGSSGSLNRTAGSEPAAGAAPANAGEAGVIWLICYEAFLPWAWIPALRDAPKGYPIVVLANDSAFTTGAVAILRHKLGHALARLTNRPVLQATTGKTFLLRRNPEESHVAF